MGGCLEKMRFRGDGAGRFTRKVGVMKRGWFTLVAAGALSLSASWAEEIKVSDYVFETGDKWVNVSSGKPMRAAELKFDAAGDEDPVAVFYFFGEGQGGGVEDNVARWKGQFQGGPQGEERLNLDGGGMLLFLSGTYLESMGGAFAGPKVPKENYRMLAAILPSEQGSVYIKLTAPAAVADQVRDPFVALVKSARKS